MFTRFRLMNEAGGLGESGGVGDTGGAAGGDTGDTGGNTGGGGEYTGPAWAKEWEGISELEPELLNDPSLQVFQNPTSLLKSYVHAQKQLGKKGVMIPTENSPKEEWDQFYAKVGVPLEDQKYIEAAKLSEDHKKKLGDEFSNQYLKLAHEMRVQPGQAAKMYEFFAKQVEDSTTKQVTEYNTKVQAELDALRDEWGPDAYQVKITKAETFLKEHAGEDFIKYLGQSGLGKNAQIVRAFASMADKLLKEGDLPNGNNSNAMTINDMEREVNTIMGNLDDPYYKTSHPDHTRRVDEVLNLNRKIEKARARN